jgi:hypothetical protein
VSATLIKFPIGRVVREHRIGHILAATREGEAIEQAARSVRQAIKTLRRQEASLNLRAARERKKETPEQIARVVEKNMSHVYAREDEDRAAEAAAAPPPDASTRQAIRALVDRWDAEAGRDGDGDDAA